MSVPDRLHSSDLAFVRRHQYREDFNPPSAPKASSGESAEKYRDQLDEYVTRYVEAEIVEEERILRASKRGIGVNSSGWPNSNNHQPSAVKYRHVL